MDDARRGVGPSNAEITLADLAMLTPEERIAVYRGLLARPFQGFAPENAPPALEALAS